MLEASEPPLPLLLQMKIKALSAAALSSLLSLALPAVASAQEGVAWTSVTNGTLAGSTVTTTGFSASASISPSDFSNFNYDFAPLSSTQDSVNHASFDNWSADFAPTITGGLLWYGSFTRGAGSFPSTGGDTTYTFNHTPVIASGFSLGVISGNTLTVPVSTFHWGILSFSGSIDTLTCTTNSTGISFQSCTLGVPFDASGPIGTPDAGCTAVANSAGSVGTMTGVGQLDVTQNDCILTAAGLPLNQFCLLVASQTSTFVPGSTINSNGNLCLGGNVARFNSLLMSSGSIGGASFTVDLGAIPLATGAAPVASGETWYFQAWHRDQVGVGSNFTESLCITFQ